MSDFGILQTPAGPARLLRSDRATLAISVLPDGTLELVAPMDAGESDILTRVSRRLGWIIRQRTTFAEMNRNRVPLRYESGATHRYLGRQYRLKVTCGQSPVGVKLSGAYFHISTRTGRPKEVETLLDIWFRDKAKEQFQVRLAKWLPWCATRKIPVPSIRILRMPKRWGSAHADGRIYLNPELMKAPSICIDYVIAHEICHLKHSHHDRAFYHQLDQLFPGWPAIRARLNQLQ